MKFKNILLIITIGLFFSNCGTTKTLTVKFNEGLNNVLPGTKLSEFKSVLGKPDEMNEKWKEKDGTVYINYYKKGVSLLVKQDTVRTVFYYFVSKTFDSFKGTIESDINGKTKIDDIKQKLGEPDRVSNSTVSKYGEFQGAKEVYLTYNKLGVAFSFLDDKLANVRQFRPR
jgi:hypothetical protein